MKIILCPNPFRDKGLKAAQNAGKLLSAAGAEVTYCFPFPVDKTIRLQFLQRHTQCFIGDRPDEFFQFIEADNAKFHKELKK